MTRDQKRLLEWYGHNKRDLPWRISRDPYRIWISEVMLQQTTVAAVIPFYEKFMTRFPSLKKLAQARSQSVMQQWAGLGYYSRARNLHKSAKLLANREFPQDYRELIKFPGFGPYTARAVASLSFGQEVGVLDGNVIRVLCRHFGLDIEWWKTANNKKLQDLADELVIGTNPADTNQALMELGANVCTPKSPACLLCPWNDSCKAFKQGKTELLPLTKPRRQKELWQWRPVLAKRRGQVAFVQNDYAPFLKGHWILPGKAKQILKVPQRFSFKHMITHHEIYVLPTRCKTDRPQADSQIKWIPESQISRFVPASLVKKVLDQI